MSSHSQKWLTVARVACWCIAQSAIKKLSKLDTPDGLAGGSSATSTGMVGDAAKKEMKLAEFLARAMPSWLTDPESPVAIICAE